MLIETNNKLIIDIPDNLYYVDFNKDNEYENIYYSLFEQCLNDLEMGNIGFSSIDYSKECNLGDLVKNKNNFKFSAYLNQSISSMFNLEELIYVNINNENIEIVDNGNIFIESYKLLTNLKNSNIDIYNSDILIKNAIDKYLLSKNITYSLIEKEIEDKIEQLKELDMETVHKNISINKYIFELDLNNSIGTIYNNYIDEVKKAIQENYINNGGYLIFSNFKKAYLSYIEKFIDNSFSYVLDETIDNIKSDIFKKFKSKVSSLNKNKLFKRFGANVVETGTDELVKLLAVMSNDELRNYKGSKVMKNTHIELDKIEKEIEDLKNTFKNEDDIENFLKENDYKIILKYYTKNKKQNNDYYIDNILKNDILKSRFFENK